MKSSGILEGSLRTAPIRWGGLKTIPDDGKPIMPDANIVLDALSITNPFAFSRTELIRLCIPKYVESEVERVLRKHGRCAVTAGIDLDRTVFPYQKYVDSSKPDEDVREQLRKLQTELPDNDPDLGREWAYAKRAELAKHRFEDIPPESMTMPDLRKRVRKLWHAFQGRQKHSGAGSRHSGAGGRGIHGNT